ncbi:cysteine-rich and transmembrane domain-containing protein WIH1-like isoform X2 [Olea europaea var. sylvestris]|uniref:cysteine-rich and transmembrane domain-containing protein WIH1-like isoform X2 n=1 Tax=Olea europaea var. sylvestris TaxID=158386 RepID=UPI000C1CF12E|nr:cysteine-rich and transmembrane domain-containing protein WIH1-like isoform X2 [Olea europaea var. sylvestris]
MNKYDQHEASAPPPSYPPGTQGNLDGPYVMAPPPVGYPTKDGDNKGNAPVETTTRGDGFLKGCLAGLCCCWCLDICF